MIKYRRQLLVFVCFVFYWLWICPCTWGKEVAAFGNLDITSPYNAKYRWQTDPDGGMAKDKIAKTSNIYIYI